MSSDTRNISIWRDPSEEREEFPGIWLADNRVSGSITLGRSRLPLWCLVYTLVSEGWPGVEAGWMPGVEAGWMPGHGRDVTSDFLYNLLSQRGEFGRLLCALATAEHLLPEDSDEMWQEIEELAAPVRAQLQRCLDVLDAAHE